MRLGTVALDIRSISCILDERMSQADMADGLSVTARSAAWLLEYVFVNADADIYQKDVERNFGVTRSAASKMLAQLEKSGLIERYRVSHDARLKKIVLTAAGREAAEAINKEVKMAEGDIFSCITAEEKRVLMSALTKINLACDAQ